MRQDGDALSSRAGFTDEIALLRPLHPRPVWMAHPNLGMTASFWLQRHGWFRQMGDALSAGALAFREQPDDADGFMRWVLPRLQLFLGELHAHHDVEDVHYFPLFRAADLRLARGFDILDADHRAINGVIHRLDEAASALRDVVRIGAGPEAAGDALAAALGQAAIVLARHLDDEEDLIIPLILDRGEHGLGIA